VLSHEPSKPKTYVSGQRQAVPAQDRWKLAGLAVRNDSDVMSSALGNVNRQASMRNELVSSGCFTTYIRRTGEGGGRPYEADVMPPLAAIPPGAHNTVRKLLDKKFGPGNARLRGISVARFASSDADHATLLQDRPNDPNVHSNCGAYLHNVKKDIEGAERAYRKALSLDENHVQSIRNLANLSALKGDHTEAEQLYRRVFALAPSDEFSAWMYGNFLLHIVEDRRAAREVIGQGLTANPDSHRLLFLRMELELLDRNGAGAIEACRRARELKANQADVEVAYAFALHINGAPIHECIDAYRTAIALAPKNSSLLLNLGQLLLAQGISEEGERRVRDAMRLGLNDSAALEAHVYLLAHANCDLDEVLAAVESLRKKGATLNWDITANIEFMRKHDPEQAELLERLAHAMAEDPPMTSLASLFDGRS
jgi:Flp pilus assembly protein TadD